MKMTGCHEFKKTDLAIIFLSSYPRHCARILEQQATKKVVALLFSIPDETAVLVMNELLPQMLTKIVSQCSLEEITPLLEKMEFKKFVLMVRWLNAKRRRALFEKMSTKIVTKAKLLLSYSHNMVGAWIKPNVLVLPEECTIQEALVRFLMESKNVGVESVYVVDSDLRLTGEVSIVKLLGENKEQLVKEVINDLPPTVKARSLLKDIVLNLCWRNYDKLPVINYHQQLIGTIRYVDIRMQYDHMKKTELGTNRVIENSCLPEWLDAYKKTVALYFNALLKVGSQ